MKNLNKYFSTFGLAGALWAGVVMGAWGQTTPSACQAELTDLPIKDVAAEIVTLECSIGKVNGMGAIKFTSKGITQVQWGYWKGGRALGSHFRFESADRYVLIHYDSNGIFQSYQVWDMPWPDEALVQNLAMRASSVKSVTSGASVNALRALNDNWRATQSKTANAYFFSSINLTTQGVDTANATGSRDDPKVFGRGARGG